MNNTEKEISPVLKNMQRQGEIRGIEIGSEIGRELEREQKIEIEKTKKEDIKIDMEKKRK